MILDIIVLIIVLLGFIAGYKRGLINTVFDTMSLVVAIIAAMKLSPIMINLLESALNMSASANYLIGVILTFLIVMFIVRFIGRKIESVLQAANINVVNKLAGGVVQGLFFAFLLSMLVWVLGNYNVLKPETKERSITYPLLEPLPEAGKSVFNALKPVFSSFWNKTTEAMESLGHKIEGNSEGDNQ